MVKLQPCGMQAEPFVRLSVERVTDNGTPETGRMGAMDAKLVSAARERMEFHETTAKDVGGQQTTFGRGGTAMNGVDNLTRTVLRVRTERKTDANGSVGRNGRGRRNYRREQS